MGAVDMNVNNAGNHRRLLWATRYANHSTYPFAGINRIRFKGSAGLRKRLRNNHPLGLVALSRGAED